MSDIEFEEISRRVIEIATLFYNELAESVSIIRGIWRKCDGFTGNISYGKPGNISSYKGGSKRTFSFQENCDVNEWLWFHWRKAVSKEFVKTWARFKKTY